MAQERNMAGEGSTSPDISSTPTQALPEQSNIGVSESGVGTTPKKSYYSPEYDPEREDYQTRTEGRETILIDPNTGKEVARALRVEGGAQTAFPLGPREQQELERLGLDPESFQYAQFMYEHYLKVSTRGMPQAFQDILLEEIELAGQELIRFRDELEHELGGTDVLEDVRKAALEFLNEVRSAKQKDMYGRDRKRVISDAKRGGAYDEGIFSASPTLKRLEATYGGLPAYIFQGIVQEIEKEEQEQGREGESINPLARDEYEQLTQLREAQRPREKKYTSEETHYGVIYRLTAETPKEFPQAVLDFTKDRIFTLADTDAEGINKEVEEIRGQAGRLLEQNRTRLEEEGQIIPETDPYFVRAKALADSIPDVLGYEKMLYKGGEEYAPKYKLRFASNSINHENAIYLENPKAALIMHLLTTVREGTYWLGHGWDVEKAEEGEISDYRREIEEQIVEYAATHELFLSENDFKFREGENPEKRNLRFSFDDNIERLLLDPDGSVRTGIETRLQARNVSQQDIDEALQRHDIRVGVFRGIKNRLDAEQGLANLTNEQRQQRIRARVWQKMQQKGEGSYLQKITEEAKSKLADARASNDLATYDKILWQWVKDYNEYRIKFRLPKWYPSNWDRVRQNIDRPTKVLDRSLSADELMAMFDPSELQYRMEHGQLTAGQREEVQKEIDLKQEEARFGFMLGRSYQIFHMQDTLLGGMRARLTDPTTGQYIGKLANDDETNLVLGLIHQVGTDPQGNPIYETVKPDRKLIRVFDVVQARLQIAIDKEAVIINQAKAELAAATTDAERDIKRAQLRDIMQNAQFIATHALKELGLVEGKLPVWSHNFLDNSTIDAFTKVLKDYGVEVAKGVGATHNNKKLFYEIIERGRRALKSEHDRAAKEFMTGTYPVFELEQGKAVPMVNNAGNPVQARGQGHNTPVAVLEPVTGNIVTAFGNSGDVLQDPQGNPYIRPQRAIALLDSESDWGDEVELSEKYRVVSKGGVKGNRQLTETRYEISTSGGVVFVEGIPQIADLGFYPLLVWLGVTDIRQLHGYENRRDELEAHFHRFFDVMDPVHHAQAQAAAINARKALVSRGIIEVGGDKKPTPGFLKEPFHAAFKSADWLQEQQALAQSYGLENTVKYLTIMQQGYRRADPRYLPYSKFVNTWQGNIPYTTKDGITTKLNVNGQDVERYRQLSYLDFALMSKSMSDQFYLTMYGILDYFQWYLIAEQEVESNRIGRAPRNWEYDNTLKWYEFRREMRKAMQRRDPEKGFVIRHGYSPEVVSEISIKMMEAALLDADYLILRDFERDRLSREGTEILSKALDDKDRGGGFEIRTGEIDAQGNPLTRRTFVIPDEKDWSTLVRPEVREALETVRRRGLLEFMREEGYSIYEIETDQYGIKRIKPDDEDKSKPKVLKEVLGKKIPPLAQAEMVKTDKSKLTSS